MKKLKPPVDGKKYYEIPKGLSEYERNKIKYTPTHFTFTPEVAPVNIAPGNAEVSVGSAFDAVFNFINSYF